MCIHTYIHTVYAIHTQVQYINTVHVCSIVIYDAVICHELTLYSSTPRCVVYSYVVLCMLHVLCTSNDH